MDIMPPFRYPALGEAVKAKSPAMDHPQEFQAISNRGIRRSALRLYVFALTLGIRMILRGMLVEGIKLLVSPVGYWRLLPNAYTYQEFLRRHNPRVLDVSSPKLPSIFFATMTTQEV